jgi:hypothetical protein
MHREVGDHIENVLANGKAESARQHLSECQECRDEVATMKEQATLLRELRAPKSFDAELRPGFYARVMERIESQSPISIWNLFIESAFGRRIAFASMALALVLGVYLFTLERNGEEPVVASGSTQLQMTPDGAFGGPVATSVSQVEGVGADGTMVQLGGQGDPLEMQMNQFVNQMNQMMLQMQQSNSQDGVLSDLVTYREQ